MTKIKIENNTRLYATFDKKSVFNSRFLDELSLIYKFLENDKIRDVFFACDENSDIDKFCLVFLQSCFLHVKSYKNVWWNNALQDITTKTVVKQKGVDFIPSGNIVSEVNKNAIELYKFSINDNTNIVINDLTDLIVEKNVTTNRIKLKEFLATTIGEIFSNAVTHSNQDFFYYAYNIFFDHHRDQFFFIATIVDFGTTLVKNVYEHFEKQQIRIDDIECVKWAIKSGNTTKKGSGGYGLATFIDYIEKASGKMMMATDSVMFSIDNGQLDFKKLGGIFPGTSVTFKVPLYNTDNCISYDERNERLTSLSLADI